MVQQAHVESQCVASAAAVLQRNPTFHISTSKPLTGSLVMLAVLFLVKTCPVGDVIWGLKGCIGCGKTGVVNL